MSNIYSKRINQIIDMFRHDDLYRACIGSDDSLSEWRVFRKYSKKVLDTTWLDVIEDALVDLDVIVRNPRRFIVVEEDLIDTSRARSVTEESVKYLAQHTNYIAGFDGDMILPTKLLNSTKEESYEVYENRFIYTLLKRLQAFVRKRYDAVKGAAAQNEQLEIVVDKHLSVGVAQVTMRLDSIVKMPFEEALKLNSEELGPIERLAKIHAIVSGFMVTPFAREMISSEPVRPPITRTNVILKNQNFKKALSLWEFLQSYDEEGYEIRSVTESEEMDDDLKNQYRLMVFFNAVFMQNLANEDFRVKNAKPRLRAEDINIDDFPKSDIPVEEVKTISVPSMYDSQLKESHRAEILGVVDRVLQQVKINKHNQEGKLYEKMVFAQRKKENEYKERLIRLRKREREQLEKEAARKEKEQLKEINEQKRAEAERIKREKMEALEKLRSEKVLKELEAELNRLDEEACNMAILATRNEQAHANRQKIAKEIIALNSIRQKLKGELTKLVDSEIDEIIKQIPKIFNVNL